MITKRYAGFFAFLFVFLLFTQAIVFVSAVQTAPKQSVIHKNVNVAASIKNIKDNIYKETFDNGLTLLFYRKEHTPEVMLKVMYDFGSKDEESFEYGFAHLVEHMIFKGTQKLSEQDIFEISRKFGASIGANTGFDSTVYYFGTDNKNWKVFLNILADCMENVRISDEHLASEIKTVFYELKEGNSDGVGDCWTELLTSNHPYRHPIVGYKENILTLEPEKVRVFYKEHYGPDRATVIVVGNLDKDDVVREVKEKFGAIPSMKMGPKKQLESKKERIEFTYINKDFFQKDIVVYKPTPNTSVSCIWAIPGEQDAKNIGCAKIVGKYLSDQLCKTLHDAKELVSSVGAGTDLRLKAGFFEVTFEPHAQKYLFIKKSSDDVIEICKKFVTKEIEQIIANGIPQDEFVGLRQMLNVGSLMMFEHCNAIANILEWSYLINRNEYEFFDRLALFGSITNTDIKIFAQKYLRPTLMNVISFKPLKDTEKDSWLSLQRGVDEYDQSLLALQKTRSVNLGKSVAAGQLPKPKLLDVVFEKPDAEFDLSNGLHVMIKQRKDVPFIASQLSFKNSNNMDRYFAEKGKDYIPVLSADLLWEGSVGYSKEENRMFFEALGASYDGSIYCLASDFDAAAQRYVHILTKPTYPKKAFNKSIKNYLEYWEKLPEDASYLANYNLGKYLQQNDFLSKKTLKEHISDLKKYKRSELVEFHKKYMVPRNMLLAIVGDFDEKTIRQQLENSYGQWKNSSYACNIDTIKIKFPALKNPVAKEQEIYLPQERVVLAAGRISVKKYDEDYFKLGLLNQYVYKKLFALREEYGLFYDCSCNLLSDSTYDQEGQAIISSELSLENVDAVVKLIKSTLNNIAKNGIPQEDFENARNSLISGWAKSDITNNDVVNLFREIKSLGFSWDYTKKRFEKYMQVSCADVSAAAKKYLNSDDWSFVFVGRVSRTSCEKGS